MVDRLVRIGRKYGMEINRNKTRGMNRNKSLENLNVLLRTNLKISPNLTQTEHRVREL